MKVKDFMSTHVITTTASESLPEIWSLIFKKHVPSILVLDKSKKLVGIITREDILTTLYPKYDESFAELQAIEELKDIKEKLIKLKKITVEKIMSRRVIYTRPETSVMRALSRMIVQKVRQLPVVDDDDIVVGVISKADIFKKIFKKVKK